MKKSIDYYKSRYYEPLLARFISADSYVRMILFILLILNCSFDKKEEHFPRKMSIEKDTSQTGKLVIKFNSKENIMIKNFRMKFSKIFPNTQYEARVTPSGFFPIPPLAMSKPRDSILYDSLDYEYNEEINSEVKLNFDLKPGSYFASFDTIKNREFSFDPHEAKEMLFSFGYEWDKEYDFNGINSNYNGECKSIYTGHKYRLTFNFVSCKKIEILQGKVTTINVKISELKKNRFEIIFSKYIPGIFILAPISNLLGYYYYRDYEVELINPE